MADKTDVEKTLEMRIAELEDKLSGLHVTEDEMKAFTKVSNLMGGGRMQPVSADQQVPSPFGCIIAQCVKACVIHHCTIAQCTIRACTIIHQCTIAQCTIRACTIEQCINECGPGLPGGGGYGGGGGFGSLGG